MRGETTPSRSSRAISAHASRYAREGAEPLLVALDVLRGVRALDRGDVSEQDAGSDEMIRHVEPVGPKLDGRERLDRDRLEDVHRRAQREIETLAIDRGELVEGGTVPGLRAGAALLADVGKAVVVALVPDRVAKTGSRSRSSSQNRSASAWARSASFTHHPIS